VGLLGGVLCVGGWGVGGVEKNIFFVKCGGGSINSIVWEGGGGGGGEVEYLSARRYRYQDNVPK